MTANEPLYQNTDRLRKRFARLRLLLSMIALVEKPSTQTRARIAIRELDAIVEDLGVS
jgi:hypothetical protein